MVQSSWSFASVQLCNTSWSLECRLHICRNVSPKVSNNFKLFIILKGVTLTLQAIEGWPCILTFFKKSALHWHTNVILDFFILKNIYRILDWNSPIHGSTAIQNKSKHMPLVLSHSQHSLDCRPVSSEAALYVSLDCWDIDKWIPKTTLGSGKNTLVNMGCLKVHQGLWTVLNK